MIAIQLAHVVVVVVVGTCAFLPLAAGQHRGFPAVYPPQLYHHHVFPPIKNDRRNLRRQQQRRLQNEASLLPFLDCGENPLVKQESGCPCFSTETIVALMDVETDADSCYYSAKASVNASDQCSYVYPRSVYFSASTSYSDTSSYSVNLAVSSNVYPPKVLARLLVKAALRALQIYSLWTSFNPRKALALAAQVCTTPSIFMIKLAAIPTVKITVMTCM
jgi:hypothetical protein